MRNGWVETTLGEVADVIDPHPSHRAPAVDENGIPFIGIGDLRKTGDIDFAKARRVSRDILEEHKSRYDRSEFLIGLGRVASIGMVVRLPDENIEYVVSPTLAVIKAREVMGQFLFYLLEGPHSQEQFQRFKKGSTRESVGMQILRKIKVQVPPLPEQKRIVDLISSVDSYIEALRQQLESAKKSRNAVLHELLTAGGDDWVETSLGEIAEVIGGGTPSTTIGEYWDGDIVWLTPTEITSQDGKVVSDSIRKITDLGFKNSGAQMLPKDSVILTSRASVGFVALAGKELCTNQGFQSLIPKPSVLSKFLMFWIQMNRPEFESRSAGSTFKEISKSNVKSMKLELPPLLEQEKIIKIVTTIDEVIFQTELTIRKAQNLRSGLLSDLLSGEHEIPVTYDKVMGAA